MNPWSAESAYFATWLHRQKPASILPSQVCATVNIVDRLDNGDLICILYNGKGDLALKALDILKRRYEDELQALNEMNRPQYPENDDVANHWS